MEEKGIILKNITKIFGKKTVLNNVDISFKEGTIHSIVGENGAGKSTLMNILSGVLKQTKGDIFIDTNKVEINGPMDSVKNGIGMVYQHFMLVPSLTVWENIILGKEPKNNIKIDRDSAIKRIKEVCEDYGIKVDIMQKVGLLTVGEQQKVEILKVLYTNAKYIILDEPTAVLTPKEITMLLDNVKNLRNKGKTIIFISHKLEEVMDISDEITVLRLGEIQGSLCAKEDTNDKIVKLMVGRQVEFGQRIINDNVGEIALDIKDISTKQGLFGCKLDKLSLDVRYGEIVGVAGVDGNGQLELVNSILSMQKITDGSIFLGDEDITDVSTSKLRAKKIACIPPDRHEQGIVLDQSVMRNAVLGCEDIKELKSGLFLNLKVINSKINELIERYDVRCAGTNQKIRGLSGGNQQKVILARECEFKGDDLIIAVNPTRGLDIGAMEFVYSQLNRYKLEGKAILLISTELSEIITLSDRISVIFKGKIMDTLVNEKVDIQEIGGLMAGIKKEDTDEKN